MEMDISEELGSDDMIQMVQRITPSSILSPTDSGLVRGANSSGGLGSGELGRRLLLASRHGDTPLVLDLMAKGAPFTTDWLGTSALHAAAGGAHVETCAVLLRAGVSRDCRTKVERTPLHLAAHKGHASVAALLLQHRAQPDCRDMLYMTPLHWAAERGHLEVAEILLKHGADPYAISKFNKTPHSIACEKKHLDIVKLIEDTVKEREAAKSVESLRVANETEANESLQNILDPIERLQEPPRQRIKPTPQPEPIKINLERPLETSSAHAEAAAAMLRRHGIALLPRDSGSTVLSALQSGRSVVLSDAGKLMLKESSEVPPTPVSGLSGVSGGKGVVLTATPVKSPPRQGVKIFTLNNKLLAMPKENKAPVKKIINPHDSLQIQYIKLPSDAKITPSKSIPMKAKNKLPSPSPTRPTVKLMMQKANLTKLIAANDNGLETTTASPEVKLRTDDRNILFVPEEYLTNTSPKYLRNQLLTAHKTIASLNAEINTYKTRLAKYEKI